MAWYKICMKSKVTVVQIPPKAKALGFTPDYYKKLMFNFFFSYIIVYDKLYLPI
jgi:hypothetical protein